jgi:hypothetical protein
MAQLVCRPNALSPRRARASARDGAGLNAAMGTLSSWVTSRLRDRERNRVDGQIIAHILFSRKTFPIFILRYLNVKRRRGIIESLYAVMAGLVPAIHVVKRV